eukprot:TRINITY_DN423_c0_g1_i2.p2 TRINITY_DN423_c0_g1~~TRINITY_DN423_c0_g1_i2.p2  ORF type:complete len:142 (+),score=5.87 TRINITY_DN423_c0_g1_i2:356-781(+)
MDPTTKKFFQYNNLQKRCHYSKQTLHAVVQQKSTILNKQKKIIKTNETNIETQKLQRIPGQDQNKVTYKIVHIFVKVSEMEPTTKGTKSSGFEKLSSTRNKAAFLGFSQADLKTSTIQFVSALFPTCAKKKSIFIQYNTFN